MFPKNLFNSWVKVDTHFVAGAPNQEVGRNVQYQLSLNGPVYSLCMLADMMCEISDNLISAEGHVVQYQNPYNASGTSSYLCNANNPSEAGSYIRVLLGRGEHSSIYFFTSLSYCTIETILRKAQILPKLSGNAIEFFIDAVTLSMSFMHKQYLKVEKIYYIY